MNTVRILAISLFLAFFPWQPAHAATGKVTGGVKYSLPEWFKPSFLDFKEEVALARESGRHILVFVHLDECPYCNRMLQESFFRGKNKDFMQRHFDAVGVNYHGGLTLTWIDGREYTEREFVRNVLKVIATPTIVFLNPDGQQVVRLDGYRDPRAFRHVLEYVHSKTYRTKTLSDYIDSRKRPVVYRFREHPQLVRTTYFKNYDRPVVLLFEDRYCGECARFHETTLNHPFVMEELKHFLFVRLDTGSSQIVVTFDGKITTASEWANSMGLSYRPAIVMFNESRERFRADGRLYKHHMMEALHYVSGAYYKKYKKMSDFKAWYRADLLKRGIDVDFSE